MPILVSTTATPHVPWMTVAYNPVNGVYLLVREGSTIEGQFMDSSGSLIGTTFPITSELVTYGWSNCCFGGPATDPAFLVTYVAVEGDTYSRGNNKYARLVRYRNGAPVISGRAFIVDVGAQWFASEVAQSRWTGEAFVVGTRVQLPPETRSSPLLSLVDMTPSLVASLNIGDGHANEADPRIDCDPVSHIGLAMGYASLIDGVSPAVGGTWARLFDTRTLAPTTPVFYVDDHSAVMQSQMVAFDAKAGTFLTAWVPQEPPGCLCFRVVHPDGTLQPFDPSTRLGTAVSDTAMAYNSGTKSVVLVLKSGPAANLYAAALEHGGGTSEPLALVRAYGTDTWPTYKTAIASDPVHSQWATAYTVTASSNVALLKPGISAEPYPPDPFPPDPGPQPPDPIPPGPDPVIPSFGRPIGFAFYYADCYCYPQLVYINGKPTIETQGPGAPRNMGLVVSGEMRAAVAIAPYMTSLVIGEDSLRQMALVPANWAKVKGIYIANESGTDQIGGIETLMASIKNTCHDMGVTCPPFITYTQDKTQEAVDAWGKDPNVVIGVQLYLDGNQGPDDLRKLAAQQKAITGDCPVCINAMAYDKTAGNPPVPHYTGDLAALVPVYADIVRGWPQVQYVWPFSYYRKGGAYDHPEIIPAWRAFTKACGA